MKNNVLQPWLATFALIILISGFFSGCSKSPEKAVESVLNQCAKTTDRINQSNMSAAESAAYLAAQMQKINTSDCPPEFRLAFQQHINAWREAAPYFAQNTSLNAFLDGLAAGALQDSSLYATSARNASIAAQNISVTYNRVVNIAAIYGSRIPRSVVEK